MNLCVYGLWHLGSVTAACLAAAGFRTFGLALQQAEADKLSGGAPPLFEPGLAELLAEGLTAGTLSFTADPAIVADCGLLWVTFDTPVDEEDVADVEFVIDRVRALFPYLKDGTVVLMSSQLPVGSTGRLAELFSAEAGNRRVSFAYSPENLRLGQAIDVFTHPERIVVGVSDQIARGALEPILSTFCSSILWTDVNSAEMVKHALNAWLATSITLTNELASICERVGGDFAYVEKALRLDPRIGARAYVRPGGAFGGGTLARDVRFLEQLAVKSEVDVFVLNAVRKSNSYHGAWALRQLEKRLGSLSGRRIGLLGLAYKAGTDAIRRSVAVELARSIASKGGRVTAFDPKVSTLPAELATDIHVAQNPECVFRDADAIVVATEWPEFRLLPFEVLIATMGNRLAIDQNGHLRESLAGLPVRLDYVALGFAP